MPNINKVSKPTEAGKRKWVLRSVLFDSETWPEVKAIAAMDRTTIRDWLDEIISAAIQKRKKDKEKRA